MPPRETAASPLEALVLWSSATPKILTLMRYIDTKNDVLVHSKLRETAITRPTVFDGPAVADYLPLLLDARHSREDGAQTRQEAEVRCGGEAIR